MSESWQPETALRRADYNHIGGYHIGVRREEVGLFSNAAHAAVRLAVQAGKPLPQNAPNVIGAWPGPLWMFAQELAREWSTLLAFQAPRFSNQPTGAIEAFEIDRERLSRKQKRGVIPILFVTEISYTKRWSDRARLQVHPDIDHEGPDKVQALALEKGICVVKTTQDELPTVVPEIMHSVHFGKQAHRLIIP